MELENFLRLFYTVDNFEDNITYSFILNPENEKRNDMNSIISLYKDKYGDILSEKAIENLLNNRLMSTIEESSMKYEFFIKPENISVEQNEENPNIYDYKVVAMITYADSSNKEISHEGQLITENIDGKIKIKSFDLRKMQEFEKLLTK